MIGVGGIEYESGDSGRLHLGELNFDLLCKSLKYPQLCVVDEFWIW